MEYDPTRMCELLVGLGDVEVPTSPIAVGQTVDTIWEIPHTGGRRCRDGAYV